MKILCLWIALLFSNLAIAQYDVEDRDDTPVTEANKNILKIDIKEPFFQIAAKNCKAFKAAGFDGGVSVYKEMLRRFMYDYLNSDFYVLNGEFTFTLTIDENGIVKDIEGSPKIANSQYFYDDMKYIVKRIKKRWTPASCNGQPIASQIKVKMSLSSMSAEM